MLTDEQRAFADSAEGRAAIAKAKADHALNAWRDGRAFTDADGRAAIRNHGGRHMVDQQALARDRTEAGASYARGVNALNDWRNN